MSSKFVKRFTLNNIVLQARKSVGTTLMLCLMLVLVGTTVYYYAKTQYAEKQSQKTFRPDLKEIELLSSDTSIAKTEFEAFVGIRGISMFEADYAEIGEDLFLQDFFSIFMDGEKLSEQIPTIYVGTAFNDIVEVTLKEGKWLTKADFAQEVDGYLYLGYDYSDIEIGSEYQYKYGNTTMRYRVAGILEKGCTCPTSGLFHCSPDSCIAMDEGIIVCNREEISASWLLSVEEASQEETNAQLRKMFEQKSGRVDLFTIEGLFDTSRASMKVVLRYMKDLIILVSLVSVIILVTSLTVETLRKKEQIGIWYANGVTKKEVYLVLSLTELVRAFLLFLFLFLAAYIAFAVFAKTTVDCQMNRYVLIHYVAVIDGIILVLAEVIGLFLPLRIIKNLSPVDMLAGGIKE